jgi:hypothetical protein
LLARRRELMVVALDRNVEQRMNGCPGVRQPSRPSEPLEVSCQFDWAPVRNDLFGDLKKIMIM